MKGGPRQQSLKRSLAETDDADGNPWLRDLYRRGRISAKELKTGAKSCGDAQLAQIKIIKNIEQNKSKTNIQKNNTKQKRQKAALPTHRIISVTSCDAWPRSLICLTSTKQMMPGGGHEALCEAKRFLVSCTSCCPEMDSCRALQSVY